MRRLVLSLKFKRAYRKFVNRDRALRGRIDDVLAQMEVDVLDPRLGAHKLSDTLYDLRACVCDYDYRVVYLP